MCKKCKDAGLVKHSDEMQLEVSPENYGSKRKPKKKVLRKHRVACHGCGFSLGHVETVEGPWSKEWKIAISAKFGTTWPYCKNCKAKREARAS